MKTQLPLEKSEGLMVLEIYGKPTLADMRRLVAFITLHMEILEDAPTMEAVHAQLEKAKPLLYGLPTA